MHLSVQNLEDSFRNSVGTPIQATLRKVWGSRVVTWVRHNPKYSALLIGGTAVGAFLLKLGVRWIRVKMHKRWLHREILKEPKVVEEAESWVKTFDSPTKTMKEAFQKLPAVTLDTDLKTYRGAAYALFHSVTTYDWAKKEAIISELARDDAEVINGIFAFRREKLDTWLTENKDALETQSVGEIAVAIKDKFSAEFAEAEDYANRAFLGLKKEVNQLGQEGESVWKIFRILDPKTYDHYVGIDVRDSVLRHAFVARHEGGLDELFKAWMKKQFELQLPYDGVLDRWKDLAGVMTMGGEEIEGLEPHLVAVVKELLQAESLPEGMGETYVYDQAMQRLRQS